MNRRKVLAGGAAALPLAVAGVSTASPVASPIAELFRQWLAAGRADVTVMSEAEAQPIFAEYQRLQREILAATPRTASDVAMQFWCDSDEGVSDHSPAFKNRMRALAGVEAVAS